MKDFLPFKAPTLHHWKTSPMPQSNSGTPWPSTGSVSNNLFDTGKDWSNPPTPAPTPAPTLKTEAPPQVVEILHAMVMPKQVAVKCFWRPHCPFCKNEEEMRKIGMATGRRNSKGCTHKTLSAPRHKIVSTPSHRTLSISSHLMSLTCTLNKSDWEESGKKR